MPQRPPQRWPSGERLALPGRPPRRLPARLTGLTARFTGLGFIDREGAPLELLTLEPGNSGFRRGAVGHLDESKAFGAAGVAVNNNTHLVHNSIRLKELAKGMVGGSKRQIAYKDIHGKVLFILKSVETIARSSEQYAGAQCKSHTQEKRRESP